jgi:uncharacterized protein with GYD domain
VFSELDRPGRESGQRRPEAIRSHQSPGFENGGRLVCAYVITGQYDVVLVVEMPNGDAMTQLSIAITSSGNARTTTVRAFAPEEFGKLAAEAPAVT